MSVSIFQENEIWIAIMKKINEEILALVNSDGDGIFYLELAES